jgi:hypothetical protein
VLVDAAPSAQPTDTLQMHPVLEFEKSEYSTALPNRSGDSYADAVQQCWVLATKDVQCTYEVRQSLINMYEAKG